MKRVLSLSTLYPNSHTPRFGTFVARSMESLAAHGAWQVTLINPIGVPPIAAGRYRALARAAQDGTEGGVEVHRPRFTLIPRFGGRYNPHFITRAVLPLIRRLHAQRPFSLVDAQFFYPDGPAAMHIANALDLPLSIKARGSDIIMWGERGYARQAMLAAARRADGLLSVSQALARDMVAMGMPQDKIALHYTGLDHDRFRPLDRDGLRARLSKNIGLELAHRQPLLASVGALVRHKGQHIVIDALAQLPDAQLLIVGTGPDEAGLKAAAHRHGCGERVHFLGSVDHDLLPLILSACDAMVLPSQREGLANAWIESLACGTPVVTCDIGGARELIDRPEAGRIVPREAPAIAQAVRDIVAAPPDPQAVAATAERFSWEQNGADLASYYDKLAGDN